MANTEPGGRRVPVSCLASPAAGKGSIPGRTARHPELDTGNRTSRGEFRLEAVPVLVYRKFSIPKLDDVNPKLDEFRQQAHLKEGLLPLDSMPVLSKFIKIENSILLKSMTWNVLVH
jgi:hypothetical protein